MTHTSYHIQFGSEVRHKSNAK